MGMFFVTWGLVSSIFSFFIGAIINLIGRFICILIVFVISITTFLFLLFWTPTDSTFYVIFIIASIFGILETSWGTINNGKIFEKL